VLVVMSKLKGFIKAHSDMRTSDGVSDPLSNHLRSICVRAVRSAKENERSTVLDRDIEAALRGETASE
jgi:histone H3/H4